MTLAWYDYVCINGHEFKRLDTDTLEEEPTVVALNQNTCPHCQSDCFTLKSMYGTVEACVEGLKKDLELFGPLIKSFEEFNEEDSDK